MPCAFLFCLTALSAGTLGWQPALAREPAAVVAQVQAQPQGAPPGAQPAPANPSASTQRHPDGRTPGMIELMNQIEDLQSEINRLRGQLEVLSNGLENAQKRQRDMYLDLDTRMRRLEQNATGSNVPRAEGPPATTTRPSVAADAQPPRAKPPASV